MVTARPTHFCPSVPGYLLSACVPRLYCAPRRHAVSTWSALPSTCVWTTAAVTLRLVYDASLACQQTPPVASLTRTGAAADAFACFCSGAGVSFHLRFWMSV